MKLKDLINAYREDDPPPFIANKPLGLSELTQYLTALDSCFSRLKTDDRVCLCVEDPLLFYLALIQLDGAVARLAVVPSGQPEEHYLRLVDKLRPSHFITDQDMAFLACASNCHVITINEDVWRHRALKTTRPFGQSVVSEWVIPTSGTSNNIKLVRHDIASLLRSVRKKSENSRQRRWACLYETARFAGLQVFLQSLAGGSSLVLPEPGVSFSQSVGNLIDHGCNAISGTPSLFRKLLMAPDVKKLPLRQITLGGEIVDQQVLDSLKGAFPSARITHIYATTETGVVFSVHDGLAGFPAAMVDGGNLKIKDDTIYVKLKDTRKDLFVGGAVSLKDGFYDTKDRVRLEGERYVFLGRDDGSVNIGGEKVFPEEIEQVFLSHPAVASALVTSRPSARVGYLLSATLTLRGEEHKGRDEQINEIRRFVSRRLPKHKIPYNIMIQDELELNTSGKMKRISS